MARVRSPNYPSIGLRAAIDMANKIYTKEHTHKAAPEVVAKAMGYTGLNGTSLGTLSALKKFGLLEEVGKELKISAKALSILVDPKDSIDRAKAIVEAAFLPNLFSDLQAEYGQKLPSDENLRSFLLKRGFALSTVDAPIRTYRETIELVDEARKIYSSAEAVEPSVDPQPETPREPVGGGRRPETEPARPRKSFGSEIGMRQDVFSVEEGVVTIEWPASLSPESLEDIEAWLTIVQRKIGRSVAKNDSETPSV